MTYNVHQALEVLERTPDVLITMLNNISDHWIFTNEGENTWSAFDIVGHLVHGERTDWIPRLKLILDHLETQTFQPFDRFAQFETSKGKSMTQLLDEFKALRHENLKVLSSLKISEADLNKIAIHPSLGEVTVTQLLATWVTHDLGHIAQISRVMAKQYKDEVGPWKDYITVLNR